MLKAVKSILSTWPEIRSIYRETEETSQNQKEKPRKQPKKKFKIQE